MNSLLIVGHDISDSVSIYDAMERNSQLKATSLYIYAPNRDISLRSGSLKGLNTCYSLTLSDGKRLIYVEDNENEY